MKVIKTLAFNPTEEKTINDFFKIVDNFTAQCDSSKCTYCPFSKGICEISQTIVEERCAEELGKTLVNFIIEPN